MLLAATSLMLPVVVRGEFDYGIRQSRHYRRYAAWLDANLGNIEIVSFDREVATGGQAVGGAVGGQPTGCCDTPAKPRSHDTSRSCL